MIIINQYQIDNYIAHAADGYYYYYLFFTCHDCYVQIYTSLLNATEKYIMKKFQLLSFKRKLVLTLKKNKKLCKDPFKSNSVII